MIGVGAKLQDCTLVGGNWIAPRIELKGEILDVNEHVFLVDGKISKQIVAQSLEKHKAAHAGIHGAMVKVMQTQKLKQI